MSAQRGARRMGAVAVGALALGLLPALTTAPATAAPRTGARIAWSHFIDRQFDGAQIVSAAPGGTGLQVLTKPGSGIYDLDPVWSPDRSKVAFERDYPDTSAVVVVNADGTGEHALDVGCVDPCAGVNEPSWTADGTRLVFTLVIGPFDAPGDSARSAVLWTSKLDGSDVRRLSEPGIDGQFEDGHARFSADGSYLTFERGSLSNFDVAVFRMDSDGANVRQLTPWELNADTQDLSQASSGATKDLVVFETYGHGDPPPDHIGDVATVPTTCATLEACTSRIRYLTDNGAGPVATFNPAWSPDGSHVAITEYLHAAKAHAAKYGDIYTVTPDGRNRHQVSTSPSWNFRPDW